MFSFPRSCFGLFCPRACSLSPLFHFLDGGAVTWADLEWKLLNSQHQLPTRHLVMLMNKWMHACMNKWMTLFIHSHITAFLFPYLSSHWQMKSMVIHCYVSNHLSLLLIFKYIFFGTSQLSVRLWFRSRSHGLWVWAPHRALCWQLRAWSLLQILCPPLSLPSPAHTLCLSLSK